MINTFYSKIACTMAIVFLLSSCNKNKNPFPVFPKVDGGALTTPINLPFIDSMNYKTTVGEYAIPPGWLEAIVPGSKEDRGWGYRATYGLYGGPGIYDGCISASAFGGNIGTDNAYLIVGPFNLENFGSVQIDFDLRREYSTDAPGSISFKYSNTYAGSGNPEAGGVSWTNIDALNNNLPVSDTQGYEHFTKSVSIPFNNVFIAIHFNGANNNKSPRWRIDNFGIKGF